MVFGRLIELTDLGVSGDKSRVRLSVKSFERLRVRSFKG
jgi:hypothetical protein